MMLFAYSAQKELMIELNSVCMQTVKSLLAVKHETLLISLRTRNDIHKHRVMCR